MRSVQNNENSLMCIYSLRIVTAWHSIPVILDVRMEACLLKFQVLVVIFMDVILIRQRYVIKLQRTY